MSGIFITGCEGNSSNSSTLTTGSPPDPEPEPEIETYNVQLKGEQSVPMVDSDNEASATVMITNGEILSATMDLSDIPGVAAAHVHEGEVGTTGGVAFAFNDNDMDGVWTIENEAVTAENLEALRNGNLYINVHTEVQADGEIRGQILMESQSVHVFELSGKQEVPSVSTNAYGHGYVFYDSASGALEVNVWTWDVEANAAHIHSAEAGLNGGVVLALETGATDGLWQSPDDSMLGMDEVMQMMDALLYVNVHSAANEGGEIRGQILPENFALILFPLDAKQEVPQGSSSASGMGYATLNISTGGLRLNAKVSGITATAAHIHQGEIATNGDVVVALEMSTEFDDLWQTPVNTALSSAQQETLLAGGHYVNVHSEATPNGELRGQMVTAPWEVLTFALDGSQEVPPVVGDASGDGYALVNTETGALDLRVITENMTASAAHIHGGTTGTNGDVAVALSQSMNNMAMWMTPENTVLEEATLNELLNAGHYVNVHSVEVPSGEIRGQILASNTLLLPLIFSGENSVPTNDSDASGEGAFTINTLNGNLRGAFTIYNMTATAAHIHEGMVGQAGGVVVGLEATDDGYKIPDEQSLTEEQISTLTSNRMYVNVHSDTYPSGEIRAQITTD
ncbi:CHRD domain-containing protein [Teredinibacter turnerae]|uniref:CHRD domain-containing protein n=1 Tax=Teredinibacter turnerae TaxID=2426 RepID=UPI000565F484|nr:CHRD domain-containing protein [Teredinibacter turnerae]